MNYPRNCNCDILEVELYCNYDILEVELYFNTRLLRFVILIYVYCQTTHNTTIIVIFISSLQFVYFTKHPSGKQESTR